MYSAQEKCEGAGKGFAGELKDKFAV